MLGIWRDSDISSLDKEDDTVNLCLMAIDDEVYHKNSFEYIFDESFETFNDLMDEYKKIRLKKLRTQKI